MSKASYNLTTLTRRAILARSPAANTGAMAAAACPAVVFTSTNHGQWTDAEGFKASA